MERNYHSFPLRIRLVSSLVNIGGLSTYSDVFAVIMKQPKREYAQAPFFGPLEWGRSVMSAIGRHPHLSHDKDQPSFSFKFQEGIYTPLE